MANPGTSTYPSTLDAFDAPGTATYEDATGYEHDLLHAQEQDAVEKIETTLGTTAGTSVLQNFAAGQFPIRNTGGGATGTLVQTIVGGTFNTSTLGSVGATGGTFTSPIVNSSTIGTPAVTGGTVTSSVLNSNTIGTPAITGGTTTSQVVNTATLGTPAITGGTINNPTLGTPAITGGTVNSATLGTPTISANAIHGSVLGTVIGARVYAGTAQPLTTATDTVIDFDSERWDTDTIHGTTNTPRLTCKTAGKYQISAVIGFAQNGTGSRQSYIRQNGGTIITIESKSAPSDANAFNIMTTIYDLAVNDYVELIGKQTTGGTLNTVAAGNYSPEFMMVRIGI